MCTRVQVRCSTLASADLIKEKKRARKKKRSKEAYVIISGGCIMAGYIEVHVQMRIMARLLQHPARARFNLKPRRSFATNETRATRMSIGRVKTTTEGKEERPVARVASPRKNELCARVKEYVRFVARLPSRRSRRANIDANIDATARSSNHCESESTREAHSVDPTRPFSTKKA